MALPRILHIGKFFPPHRGGMEAFLRCLMTEQSRQGADVHALVHSTELRLTSRSENIRWQGESLSVTRAGRWFTAAFVPVSPGFALQLRRILREFRPDVLHLHLPNPSAFLCLLLPAARKLPIVIHWHSDVVPSRHKLALRLLYSGYRWPERWLLKLADRIIATSPPYLETSAPLTDFTDKCRVIPLGIDETTAETPQEFSRWTPRAVAAVAGREPEPLRVLAVGRLTYYKGFTYLLQAVARTPGTTLTLVGDGDERDTLLSQARELSMGPRLQHVEDCNDDELLAIYRAHDVLCLPSLERTEAFGLVLLEAMREGTTCLVTEVRGSGMAWVVDAPRSGASVAAEDPDALAKMLSILATDRDMLVSLRESARSRFDSLFRISAISQSIVNVYAELKSPGR